VSNERILLVEDNPVEARGLTRVLEQHGYSVAQAGDAKEAMKALRSKPPRLVILDINLPAKDVSATPKWDGLDLLKWMQVMTGNSVPVIVQTGLSLADVQRRLGEFRMAACFQKPVREKDLMAAIGSALAQAGTQASTGAATLCMSGNGDP
jgi:CheY-like chemotaxis protein